MRAAVTAGLLTGFFVVAGAAPALAAGNPSGTGLPSQSCQDIEAAGGTVPGNSSSSPGSPFNEPGINSAAGGIGGPPYNQTPPHDVGRPSGVPAQHREPPTPPPGPPAGRGGPGLLPGAPPRVR